MKQVPLVAEQDPEGTRIVGVAEVYDDGTVRSCRIEDFELIRHFLDTREFYLAKEKPRRVS